MILFTVTPQDQFNNTATGYSGTVHFTSSDTQAVLPADTALTNGTGTFSATLKTAGTQTIIVTDSVTSTITGASGNISVVLTSAAAPTFSPSPFVTYYTPQTVSMADSTPGVTIYYTTDGSTPTTTSTSYTGPILLSTTTTINAIAASSVYAPSPVASVTYTVAQPADLIESSVSALTPNPVSGGSLSISDSTSNLGPGSAGGSLTGFYLSTNGTTLGTYLGTRSVGILAAGGSSGPVTTTLSLPLNLNGPYYAIACANYSNAVVETNYNNNCTASAAFNVIGPDLIESSVNGPTTGVAGGTISVTDTTTNQGGGGAFASYTMFYVSSDGKTKGAMLTYRSVPVLALGGSSSATTSMTLPANITGTNYVLVCANGAAIPIMESNTANDCTASAAFTVAGPDLIESSVTGPTTGVAGGTISVSDTTTNQGAGAAGASYTMYYLSTDGKTQGAMLTYRSVAALATNASSSATTSMTLPANVTGTNYVLVCANGGNSPIPETNTANDCTASAAFMVAGADLIESSVTGPSTGVAGGSISVTDTTTNQGGGAAGASYTMLYLSTDGKTKGAMLTYRSVVALAAGASSSATTSMTLPANVTGTNYVLVCANNGGTPIPETNTANDCTASAAFTVAGADLIESSVTGPSTGVAGGIISVSDTTTNQGGGAAGASYTMFYLSTDGKTKGTMLTYRSVAALASGANSSATTSMTLPANITGSNYVLVCANGGNSPIVESNTANNCTASAAFTVAGADLIESSVTGPSSGAAGGTISVTDTTTNQGGGAAGASYTMIYLSADGKTKGAMLTYRSVGALAAGASSSATSSMTLPMNISGTNYVLVCANNSASPIVEMNTANNCTASAAFTVAGPDLIESSVTGPTSGVAGGTISVSDTTTNQGGGATSASYTMFYLSTGKTKGAMLTVQWLPWPLVPVPVPQPA